MGLTFKEADFESRRMPRQRLREGLAEAVRVDSAGTYGYHRGSPPDARAVAHAAKRGIDISGLRAREVGAADFERFDLLLGR